MTTKTKAEEPAVEDDGKTEVATRLTARHHLWLEARARIDGRTASAQLEKIVREAWQNDPYKKEVAEWGTAGNVEGMATMPAKDFKP